MFKNSHVSTELEYQIENLVNSIPKYFSKIDKDPEVNINIKILFHCLGKIILEEVDKKTVLKIASLYMFLIESDKKLSDLLQNESKCKDAVYLLEKAINILNLGTSGIIKYSSVKHCIQEHFSWDFNKENYLSE